MGEVFRDLFGAWLHIGELKGKFNQTRDVNTGFRADFVIDEH